MQSKQKRVNRKIISYILCFVLVFGIALPIGVFGEDTGITTLEDIFGGEVPDTEEEVLLDEEAAPEEQPVSEDEPVAEDPVEEDVLPVLEEEEPVPEQEPSGITVLGGMSPMSGDLPTMTVETTTANESFILPITNTSVNNLTVDWGDGSQSTYTSAITTNSAAVTHTYTNPGDYVITFDGTCYRNAPSRTRGGTIGIGFIDNTTPPSGYNCATNRNKIVEVDGDWTNLLLSSTTIDTAYYGDYLFSYLRNDRFTMGNTFTVFGDRFDDVSTVGTWFATAMFYGCNGRDFTMNQTVNPPLPSVNTSKGLPSHFRWQDSFSQHTV
jgi:hypothetical protein